jgi:hypothetical protein
MIDFLSGAVAMAYIIAALYFLQFWQRAGDRLFLAFAVAFALFAINQLTLFAIGSTDEIGNYTYLLRVLGFVAILAAIVEKNVARGRKER